MSNPTNPTRCLKCPVCPVCGRNDTCEITEYFSDHDVEIKELIKKIENIKDRSLIPFARKFLDICIHRGDLYSPLDLDELGIWKRRAEISKFDKLVETGILLEKGNPIYAIKRISK